MEGKLAFKTDVILERGSEKSIIKWLPAASWDGNRKPLTLPAWDSIQVGNVIWFFSSFGSGKKKHFWFELSFPRYWGLEHPMTQDTLEGNKILKFFIAWCFSPTTLNPLLGTREDYLMLRSLTGKLMRARSWLASPAHDCHWQFSDLGWKKVVISLIRIIYVLPMCQQPLECEWVFTNSDSISNVTL